MLQDFKARLGGAAFIGIGLALGWIFLLGPLQEAERGVPDIRYSLKAFLVVPLGVVFGTAFLLGGSKFSYRNAAHTNLTPIGWVLFGIVAAATAVGFWWFQQRFAALGYR